MFPIILAIAIIFIGIWIKRLIADRQRLNGIFNKFGTMKKNFLLGHVIHFIDTPDVTFQKLHNYIRDLGPITTFWGIGNYVELMISDPKTIEEILVGKTQTKKSFTYDFLTPWLGHGLLTASGSQWFKMRKILTPTFHFKILENFVYVFNRQEEILINKIRKFVDAEQRINIYEFLTACTMDNICETAMGVKINAQTILDQEYVLAVKELAELIFMRMFGLFNQYPTLYGFTAEARRQKVLVKIINGFIDGVIKTRREQLCLETSTDEHQDEFGIKSRKSFLDLLLQSSLDGQPLSNEEIRQEVNTFTFAGHDTTTSALSFVIYNLAMHPEIQEKVFQEQKSLFGSQLNTYPNFNQLSTEMKYLEMVIKESQRLFPSVPLIARESLEPITIEGREIPPNTCLNIVIYTLHRNPKIYPDPERFDPERFTEEEISKRGPYDFIPFSAGARNCLGQRFAMLQIKSILSAIIRNFKITATDDTRNFKYTADLVLRPMDGLYVGFEERKY